MVGNSLAQWERAQRLSATVSRPSWVSLCPLSNGGEPEFRQSQILECVCPHTVIVNAHGERFSDETYFQGTVEALRHYDIWRREYKNSPCYLIFDSQYVETFSFCGAAIGVKPPAWVSSAGTSGRACRQVRYQRRKP